MSLLSQLPAQNPAIQKGVQWLLSHSRKDLSGAITWNEEEFTGTGFPNHFYLRYHYYRHYFPMMALGRYYQTLSS